MSEMAVGTPGEASPPTRSAISFRSALRVWVRVAALSFGGPAGQIAVMQRILVDEKGWVSQARFLHALNYCMLLPGPEAQQLATYVGWVLHRVRGGITAGVLFVLPGFVSILGLSVVYALWSETAIVSALFLGLKPAVLAVVVEALLRIGRRSLQSRARLLMSAGAFIAIFFFDIPFPLIVVLAGLIGWLGGRRGAPDTATRDATSETDEPTREISPQDRPAMIPTLRTAAIWLTVWWAPILALYFAVGPDNVLVEQGLFFSQTAVVTFGGAYAVLAYIAQRAVADFGWLGPGEMLDGLGMAETTPGPLIQVVQFVAFMGAFRNPGNLDPLVAGLAGSVVATWATFAPCFLWIFLGAPYIEWLRGVRALSEALSMVTAAVAGVILNLSVWFALHTLFATVDEVQFGVLRLWVPHWDTLDPASAVIALGSFAALFVLRWEMLRTLAAGAAAGFLWTLLTQYV